MNSWDSLVATYLSARGERDASIVDLVFQTLVSLVKLSKDIHSDDSFRLFYRIITQHNTAGWSW